MDLKWKRKKEKIYMDWTSIWHDCLCSL